MDKCLQLTIGRAGLGTAASHYAARLLRAIFARELWGLPDEVLAARESGSCPGEEGLGCVAQPSVRYNELNINKLSYYPCRNSGRDKVLKDSISASSGPRVLRAQKDKLPIQETSRQHICRDARFLLLAKYQHFTRLHVVNFNHV